MPKSKIKQKYCPAGLKCTCHQSAQQNSQVDYPCIQLQTYRVDSILP